MTKLQTLLEMRQRDTDICVNLGAVKGMKYAETVSAFANLLSLTELLGKAHSELSKSIRAVTCDAHQAVAKLLGVDFEAFMDDVVMVAQSRIEGASAVMQALKSKGDDRG